MISFIDVGAFKNANLRQTIAIEPSDISTNDSKNKLHTVVHKKGPCVSFSTFHYKVATYVQAQF